MNLMKKSSFYIEPLDKQGSFTLMTSNFNPENNNADTDKKIQIY